MTSFRLRASACALAVVAAAGGAVAIPQHVAASGFDCEMQAVENAFSLPLSGAYSVNFEASVTCSTTLQSLQLSVSLQESTAGSPYSTVATGGATTSSPHAHSVNSYSQACTSGSQASFQVLATFFATATDGTTQYGVVFDGPTTLTCDMSA